MTEVVWRTLNSNITQDQFFPRFWGTIFLCVKNILLFPQLKESEWNIHFPWLFFTVKLNIKRGENILASSFPEKNNDFQKGKVTGRNIWQIINEALYNHFTNVEKKKSFHNNFFDTKLATFFFSPKATLKIRRESYCTCTSLSFQKFRKYFWLYSCVGKETKLYSCMGRYACLKDMFFVLKYFLPQKVKMHHNVRQNNLSLDRYDDLWIGCWSLKRQYNFGGNSL